MGDEYDDTRHNIGFSVLDAFVKAAGEEFSDRRYGSLCQVNYKGRIFILLKPSTYMNLSGNAVSYWLKKEKIHVGNLLVIVDDIALPTGTIRMRPKGSDGGHNGLANINMVLGTTLYPRIRIGIGSNFRRGAQRNYVLGRWTTKEKVLISKRIDLVIEMIKSFGTKGVELTMTEFNKAGKIMPDKDGENDQAKIPDSSNNM
jgi:PTH1 family peptidyl-tRNA hydrolase